MSSPPKTLLTPQEYLEIERKAEFKSEYFGGEMFAMAGASEVHSLICTNAIFLLMAQLRNRDCRVYGSDMRVKVSASGLYTYPDVSVVCGQRQMESSELDVLLNPIVIIEVLSPSTEAYDRGRKFEHYRSITTLQQYVLISADRIAIDVFTRDSAGRWLLSSSTIENPVLRLESIDCSLSLADVYSKTDLLPE